MLFIAYSLPAQAAKVEFHAYYEMGSISATETAPGQAHDEGDNIYQRDSVSEYLNSNVARQPSPIHRLDERTSSKNPDTTEQHQDPQATELVSTSFDDAGSVIIQKEPIAEISHVNLLNHSDLMLISQEFLSNFIDDDITLETIVEDTINMAQQINNAWNEIDDQLTRKLYQGLGYLGIADTFNGENRYNQQNSSVFKDNLYGSGLASETERFIEPGGFFGFLLKLPKLFTLYNLILVTCVLLAGNGLFRIVRYVLLRI